jgi:hypothetical protein
MVAAKLARVAGAACDTIVVGYLLARLTGDTFRPTLIEKEL